jgi:hypothetical protein
LNGSIRNCNCIQDPPFYAQWNAGGFSTRPLAQTCSGVALELLHTSSASTQLCGEERVNLLSGERQLDVAYPRTALILQSLHNEFSSPGPIKSRAQGKQNAGFHISGLLHLLSVNYVITHYNQQYRTWLRTSLTSLPIEHICQAWLSSDLETRIPLHPPRIIASILVWPLLKEIWTTDPPEDQCLHRLHNMHLRLDIMILQAPYLRSPHTQGSPHPLVRAEGLLLSFIFNCSVLD